MAEFNGFFEVDASGWSPVSTATLTWQTTVAQQGQGSLRVALPGAAGDGAFYLTDAAGAAQGTTWTVSGAVQAHAPGDAGAIVNLRLTTQGGTGESFDSSNLTLGLGWQFASATGTFLNAAHTAASIVVRTASTGPAATMDVDSVTYARHVAYLPSGNPFVTGLWFAGVPAANHNQPSNAVTGAIIQSGLYVGA